MTALNVTNCIKVYRKMYKFRVYVSAEVEMCVCVCTYEVRDTYY